MRYIVRYRQHSREAGTRLIVEDEQGVPYLFCNEKLHPTDVSDVTDINEGTADRLLGRFRQVGPWLPVPPVSPYSLEELRQLVDGSRRVSVAVMRQPVVREQQYRYTR